jgi:hypothetical protein
MSFAPRSSPACSSSTPSTSSTRSTSTSSVDVAWRALKGVVGWLLLLAAVALAGRVKAAGDPARRPDLRARGRAARLRAAQTVLVLLAWRLLEWDVPAGVQLAALIAGSAAATLALYELLRRIPGAGVLLGQRKRSSSSGRTSAAAPALSPAVT